MSREAVGTHSPQHVQTVQARQLQTEENERRHQREVTLGTASAYDLHHRLLPQLRQIADARLERGGRVASPETLGRWWELLRPDRPTPDDRYAPGISQSELRALVADLQRL